MLLINLINNNSVIINSIDDTVNGMFPTPLMVIVTFISLMLLTIIVTKFAYKPIKKNLDARHEFTSKNLNETIKNNKDSNQKLIEADKSLENAHLKSEEIIENASSHSLDISNKILLDAKKKSEYILDETRSRISSEKKEAKVQIRDEMVDIALEAAKQIVNKEINDEVNKKIIDDFIDSIE